MQIFSSTQANYNLGEGQARQRLALAVHANTAISNPLPIEQERAAFIPSSTDAIQKHKIGQYPLNTIRICLSNEQTFNIAFRVHELRTAYGNQGDVSQFDQLKNQYGVFDQGFRTWIVKALNNAITAFEHMGDCSGEHLGIETEPFWSTLDSEGFGKALLGTRASAVAANRQSDFTHGSYRNIDFFNSFETWLQRSDLPAHCSVNFLFTFVEAWVDIAKLGRMWTNLCFVDLDRSVFRNFNYSHQLVSHSIKLLYAHCFVNENFEYDNPTIQNATRRVCIKGWPDQNCFIVGDEVTSPFIRPVLLPGRTQIANGDQYVPPRPNRPAVNFQYSDTCVLRASLKEVYKALLSFGSHTKLIFTYDAIAPVGDNLANRFYNLFRVFNKTDGWISSFLEGIVKFKARGVKRANYLLIPSLPVDIQDYEYALLAFDILKKFNPFYFAHPKSHLQQPPGAGWTADVTQNIDPLVFSPAQCGMGIFWYSTWKMQDTSIASTKLTPMSVLLLQRSYGKQNPKEIADSIETWATKTKDSLTSRIKEHLNAIENHEYLPIFQINNQGGYQQESGYPLFANAPEYIWKRHCNQIMTVLCMTGTQDKGVVDQAKQHSIKGTFFTHDDIEQLFLVGRRDPTSAKDLVEIFKTLNFSVQKVSPFSLGLGHNSLGTKSKSKKDEESKEPAKQPAKQEPSKLSKSQKQRAKKAEKKKKQAEEKKDDQDTKAPQSKQQAADPVPKVAFAPVANTKPVSKPTIQVNLPALRQTQLQTTDSRQMMNKPATAPAPVSGASTGGLQTPAKNQA